MKVTAEIDVMPKEYFKHLCDITIKDIKKSTNKVHKTNLSAFMSLEARKRGEI